MYQCTYQLLERKKKEKGIDRGKRELIVTAKVSSSQNGREQEKASSSENKPA
jgi:hypothetical protein